MNTLNRRDGFMSCKRHMNGAERSRVYMSIERRYLMLGGDTRPLLVPKEFRDPKGPWRGLRKKNAHKALI